MKYCTNCGKAIDDEARFCPACGKGCGSDAKKEPETVFSASENTVPKTDKGTVNSDETWFDSITRVINGFAGGSGAVRLPLGVIFGGIFKKHSKKEAEEIFACGTETTTPELTDDSMKWQSPWLWTRVLLAFLVALFFLHVCCDSFDNMNSYPGVILIGSFMVPIALLIFFFELNTPKNISFFSILKYFLVGGCASLLATLFLYNIVSFGDNEWVNAMIIGVVEEVGKLAIVAIIIWNSKTVKYAINGLLIGAAIGAGFAAFESSGYAFRIFINNLLGSGNVAFAYGEMTENIFLRAFLAPGGHIVWAAIAGYAVMLIKGDKQLDMSFLNKKAFWKIFWIPIVLHGVWDMPISLGGDSLIVAIIPQILLSLIAWVVVLILISNSLAQIGNILKREAAEKSGVDVI